jgi:hypothetical protein
MDANPLSLNSRIYEIISTSFQDKTVRFENRKRVPCNLE